MKINFVFLLIALGAEHSSMVLAQAPGTFAATGDMTSRRFFHTATLLTDGRVLIAGGSMRASAELFDPRTGKFTATRNSPVGARLDHGGSKTPTRKAKHGHDSRQGCPDRHKTEPQGYRALKGWGYQRAKGNKSKPTTYPGGDPALSVTTDAAQAARL